LICKAGSDPPFLFPSEKAKLRMTVSPPDKTIEHIVRQLRHGKQRDKERFQASPVPIAAEEPLLIVPNSAVPQ
jgi:hypothetical protein